MDARPSGVPEYTLNLLKEILKLDTENEYRLFYNCFGDCPNLPEFNFKNVKLVKYNYPNKILNYLYFKIFNYPKIDKELEADIFFMPHINFIGMSKGAKSVITVHDLSFLRYPEFFSARKNFWHKMVNVKKLLKRFDLIVAVSENTKKDIIELCDIDENKIKVIYSGIDERCQKLPIKKKLNLPEKFILYLGTIEPRKNVDGIIRAYGELKKTNPDLANVQLLIAGERGWKSKKIYQEWEKSEFKNDIQFLGYVGAEEKVSLYNSASVFIYPSFYEGFGFPPLEAMACGCPVITSHVSSLPEVVSDAAITVNPYDINNLAQALNNVLTDENLKNKLITRGLEQAKKFNWQKTAQEYLKILNG